MVEELEKAHQKGENTLKRAENRVSNWTTKLMTAKTQTLRAGKAVEQNKKYIDEADASFDNCAKSIDRYGKKTKDTEQYTKEAFTKLAGVMTASGIKDTVEDVARSLQECAEAAEKFGASSAKVGTIADTSKISMQKLNNQMLALSSSTGKGVSDIAESTYQAISASVDSSKAVSTVGTATKLATGGFTEASTAIDGLTTVMNSYGDKVKDASEVSDVFITVQNQGKTTVDELASSIGRVATNAANYNVSIQDLGAAYIEMTKRGVETSEATTYSNSMLKELAKNGSTVSEILKKKTGKSFAELMEDGKSLGDVIGILSSSVGGNATEFSNLWSSQEAGTAATILLKTGTEEYNKTLQNAKGSTYSSQHMWGIAFDIAINDSKLLYDTATIKKVAVIAKKIGLGWGGDWTSIVDTPHFYLTKWGSTTSQLKSLYATPDVFKKTWKKKVKREKGLLLWKAESKLTGSYLRIPNGATVEVLYTKGWYTKVRYKGKVGYVNKKFVA